MFAALLTALASLSFAAFLGGCTSVVVVEGLSSEELSAIQSKNAAVVLYRVTATEDGKALGTPVAFGIEDFVGALRAEEIGGGGKGPVPPTLNRTPSLKLGEEGWRYLVLPTGTYRLWINAPKLYNPKTGFPTRRNPWRTTDGANRAPLFWLKVPRGRPLLYAGSIHLTCSTDWKGSSEVACSGDVAVADETKSAQAVARASFGDYGPLATALMRHYGAPIESRLVRDLRPMALSTTGQEKRVRQRYFAWLARGGGGCSEEGCLELLMLAMAYLPVGSVLAVAEALFAENKWGQCMQDLAQGLRDLEPVAQLRRRLRWKLRERGIGQSAELPYKHNLATAAARGGFKSVLQADIQRVLVRECEKRGTFCLEVAVRARLLEVSTNKAIYDTVFLYSNPARRVEKFSRPALSEFLTTPFSQGHDMAAYCGAGGRKLLKQEFTRALDLLVEKILPEVPLAGR